MQQWLAGTAHLPLPQRNTNSLAVLLLGSIECPGTHGRLMLEEEREIVSARCD